MQQQPEYTQILKTELTRRCGRNQAYSLRRFARALNIPPSALSLILAGKRVPSLKAAQRIMKALDLNPTEQQRFLASLSEAQRARGLKRLNPAFRSLSPPLLPASDLDSERFHCISDWYHVAILVLTETDGFSEDPAWIARQLGIAPVIARLALERLLKFGLLTVRNGKLRPTAAYLSTTRKDSTSEALRLHQRQLLEKATESLNRDPIETRSMTGVTMAIDPELIPKAREMISEFNRKLCSFLEGGKRRQVFQLQTSLFPVQREKEGTQ